jgi:hypothetical protein
VKLVVRWILIMNALLWLPVPTRSQSLGNAGTIECSAVDQSHDAVAKGGISIHNAGCLQSVVSGTDGSSQLTNILPVSTISKSKLRGFNVSNLGVGTEDLHVDGSTHFLQPTILVTHTGFVF